MSRVIAALDDSSATRPVLATAKALATLLDAQVDPVQVADPTDTVGGTAGRIAEWAAQADGLSLRVIEGPLVETLVETGEAQDVAAVVLGARGSSLGPRPLGSTALAVATSLSKPIVVVPPDARVSTAIRRVFVPVEGAPSSAGVPDPILDIIRHGAIEVIAVYVAGEMDLPAFTDQPQHEVRAWADEFLRRYCAADIETLSLQTRIGRPEDVIPLIGQQIDPDLIALSWSQQLAEGRAWVIRAVLERCRCPVLLVPVAQSLSS